MFTRLGLYYNRAANGYGGVEFVYFLVGDADAAVGPVEVAVEFAEEGVFGAESVDFDGAARRFVELLGAADIRGVGVGYAEVFVANAVGVSIVDGVGAFGCFFVTFVFFGSNGVAAQGNGISFYQLLLAVGLHDVLRFVHYQTIDVAMGR